MGGGSGWQAVFVVTVAGMLVSAQAGKCRDSEVVDWRATVLSCFII